MREGWGSRPLGDVLRQVQRPVSVGGLDLVPFAGVRWYAEGVYHRDDVPASTVKTKTLNRIAFGDIVYNRMWATKASFGVVKDDADGCLVTNDFPIFEATEAVLPGFVGLLFQWQQFQTSAAAAATGTTERKRLNEKEFVRIKMPIPPLREQLRIVDLIRALDDAIAAAEASAAATDALSQRARDALPDGTIRPIGEVLMRIESGTSTKPVGGDGEKVFVLTLAAIRPGRFHRSEIKDVGAAALPTKARLVESDLLITRSNTPDRVGYVCVARHVPDNTYIPDLVWRLVIDERHVTKDYLEQALSSTRLREAITGSASGTSQSMRKINKAGFARIHLPIPGFEVQDEYVAPLRQLAGVRAEYDSHLARLRVLRSNMLAALLSGEHEIPKSYDELMEVAS